MNYRKLKAARVEQDVSVNEIAKALSVDCATVYRKLSGKTEFVLSEIVALRDLLHLSDTDFQSIFFNSELTETQDTNEEDTNNERSNKLDIRRE